jgi:hypothetical protein
VRWMWGCGAGGGEGGDACVGGDLCSSRCDHSFLCEGIAGISKAVDILNAITGNWSTTVLSEARNWLVATSLPNEGIACFAGGQCTSCDCHCDDCREACGVRWMWGGWMHTWEECGV